MDELSQFVREFNTEHIGHLSVGRHDLRFFGNLTAAVVYRRGQLQVELVTMAPYAGAAPHRHPHVDAYELPLCGELAFVIGEMLHLVNVQFESARPVPVLPWMAYRVRPQDWHAARAGRHGAMFFSVQHWLDMQPTAAGLDWEGPPMSNRHEEILEGAR